MSRRPFLGKKKKKDNYYSHFTVEYWDISLKATYIYKINVKALLTSLRCSSTLMCKMAIMKLNMLSMFWVRVCWMSLRRWVGNVWKVITSSANLNRINITSSVWASYERHKWIFIQHDSLTINFSKSMTTAKMCWWIATLTWCRMKMNMTNPLVSRYCTALFKLLPSWQRKQTNHFMHNLSYSPLHQSEPPSLLAYPASFEAILSLSFPLWFVTRHL